MAQFCDDAPVTVSRAIILAAGQGTRLLPLTETRPKCLIDLSGRSVLAWQLTSLRDAGVPEAVVVTGFAANVVDAEIAHLDLGGMRVRSLYNPFYALADNTASCWAARQEFEGDVLLLNGDTLFETEIARRLLAAPPAEITVTIDRKDTYDADDMKVLTEGAKLRTIGKTIETYDAESIGFLRFDAAGSRRFVHEVETTLRRPEGLRQWYLSVIDRIARQDGCVSVQSIEGLQWGELDFPQDVERAQSLTAGWT